MKLAKNKKTFTRFKIPFKIFQDDENIPEEFDFISNQIYPAVFQYVIFENGHFDYENKQRQGIVATIENRPYIFVIQGCFIVEQIPFDTKVDVNKDNIMLRGIFAINKSNLDNYDELQVEFEKNIKADLLKNIQSQIDDLTSVKKYLEEDNKSK